MFAWQATVQDESGKRVPFPVVTVYEGDGETLASIFAEDGGALENPLTGSIEGFVQFWAEPGRYKVVGANGGQTQEWEIEGGGLEVAELALSEAESAFEATEFQTVREALKRPVIRRARDSVSALDLMSAGGLDEAVRNREAFASDSTEITDAFQEVVFDACRKSWTVDVPSGEYRLNRQITADRAVAIKGSGASQSYLRWGAGASTSGILIESVDGDYSQAIVEGLRLTCGRANAGAAIRVDFSASIDPVRNRSNPRLLLRDVQTYQEGAGWWSVGLDLYNVMWSSINRHTHRGYLIAPEVPESQYLGVGLRIDGDTDPAEVFADHICYTAIHTAVQASNCEGIWLSKFSFPTCWDGIRVHNQDVTTWGGEPLLYVTDGHINARNHNIDLEHVLEYRIMNVSNYLRYAPIAPGSMIRIGPGNKFGIMHSNMYRFTVNAFEHTAISVEGGQDLSIYGEQFRIGSNGRGIHVGSGAVRTDIGKCDWIEVGPNRIVNDSGTTTAAEFSRYGGSLDDIASQGRRLHQVHTLSGAATGLPAGVTANASVVETFSFDGNTGTQVLYPINSNAIFRRRRFAGEWLSWNQI